MYTARSTAIGCVDEMSAAKESFVSSGTSVPAPTVTLKRLVAGTVTTFVAVCGFEPGARRNVSVTSAGSCGGKDDHRRSRRYDGRHLSHAPATTPARCSVINVFDHNSWSA